MDRALLIMELHPRAALCRVDPRRLSHDASGRPHEPALGQDETHVVVREVGIKLRRTVELAGGPPRLRRVTHPGRLDDADLGVPLPHEEEVALPARARDGDRQATAEPDGEHHLAAGRHGLGQRHLEERAIERVAIVGLDGTEGGLAFARRAAHSHRGHLGPAPGIRLVLDEATGLEPFERRALHPRGLAVGECVEIEVHRQRRDRLVGRVGPADLLGALEVARGRIELGPDVVADAGRRQIERDGGPRQERKGGDAHGERASEETQ